MQAVPDNINFAKAEEETLKLWRKLNAFHKQNEIRKDRPRFSFYDGPPFATGLPHFGHILASTIKDTVTRDAVMNNFYVERRFGWDTHGLPVEFEIDKKLGITGPQDVFKMGIKAYNEECRKIVMTYSNEWENTIERLGRWIDFKNDYKTMYPSFMESVWWVFKQIYDKGLVYKGFKVMPFSTKCNTPLANFEANQNYQEVVDPSVIITFPLVEDSNTALVAWTTTPWTLPSNLAACVHPDLEYVKVQDLREKSTLPQKQLILMEVRLSEIFKSENDYKILEKFKGSSLKGKEYVPLFNYFSHFKERGAFRVQCDTYVTTDSGTGVVHQAPYFGVDDYRVCMNAKIISKDGEIVCPVDSSGRYTDQVSDFKGVYVKDADKDIIKLLRTQNRLVSAGQVKHNYPFCWRSNTPLLYKAVPSWFIRVEEHRDSLIKSNNNTYWVPQHVKDKRFHNWLANACDWAVSRNRYWGTPIPIWMSEDGEETVCIGSIAELEKLSGQKITDLHRENIDPITIPSARKGMPPLKRISEVFDCWFESGSMPYAQSHYPFENDKQFDDSFPADFIAEGVDQTRGWFYTLTVLGTLLFGKSPFKNLIVNGLVLAKDGQKMSKSKKNYTDPMLLVNQFGADAIRLYLINSPVVRAEDLRFKDDGVKDICKDVFLPWYNSYRFLVQNAILYEEQSGKKFVLTRKNLDKVENFMDKWILSELGSLVKFVKDEMKAFRLYTVVGKLVNFFNLFTNGYINFNRSRLRCEGSEEDCVLALTTLAQVLFILCKRMAPFTPFLTEHIYQGLRKIISPEMFVSKDTESVHFLLLPSPEECGVINIEIERAMHAMQSVVKLARVSRERKNLPIRLPLKELVVVHENPLIIEDINKLSHYITKELNFRKITTTTDKSQYGVKRRAEPDVVKLGKRLKKDAKKVAVEIRKMTEADIEKFVKQGSGSFAGFEVTLEEIRVLYTTEGNIEQKFEPNSDGEFLILLDTETDAEMQEERAARDVINRIQRAKKEAKLVPTDKVVILLTDQSKNNEIVKIGEKYKDMIETQIRSELVFKKSDGLPPKIFEQDNEVNDVKIKVEIFTNAKVAVGKSSGVSSAPYVLVDDMTVLLENPKGNSLFKSKSDLEAYVSKLRNQPVTLSNGELSSGASFTTKSGKNTSPSEIVTVNANGLEYYLVKSTKKSTINNLSSLKSNIRSLLARDVVSDFDIFSDEKKSKKLSNDIPNVVYV